MRRGTANERSLVDVALAGALLAAVMATYAPVVGYDFINYDDPAYVAENPHVREGLTLASVRWALTGIHASNWFPLTWMSHMADYQLFGLHAGAHHAVSVALHAASAVLVFLAFRLMTGDVWPSALLAAVFALHPLRVESVAWIAERKDVLAGVFWMVGLWCYARYARRPSTARLAALLVAFALALLSKASVVTFPLACLLLDWWPLGRMAWADGPPPEVSAAPPASPRRLVVEKLPLVALAAAAAVITVVVQAHHAGGVLVEQRPAVRVASALLSYALYLRTTIWPSALAVFYPLHGAPPLPVVAGLVVLAAITVVAVRERRRRPYLVVGWLWYLVTLLPMIDLVRLGGRDLADRYTYIPSIGLGIMAAWGLRELAGPSVTRRRAAAVVASALVFAMAVTTRVQLGHWRDSIALYEHALAVTTDNYLAHYNLGVALADAGRPDEALVQYREAVRIKPDYALAHGNLGKLLAARGERDAAIAQYEAALRADPRFAEAHNNLAIALEESGRQHEAIVHYAEAVRLSPERADGYFNLAAALSAEHRTPEVIAALQQALRIRPDFLEARVALADALASAGHRADARRAAEEALALARSSGRQDVVAELEARVAAYRD